MNFPFWGQYLEHVYTFKAVYRFKVLLELYNVLCNKKEGHIGSNFIYWATIYTVHIRSSVF